MGPLLLAGLGSVISGLGNFASGAANSAVQYNFQSKLNQQQNDWNYQMWKENNEYNSAASQVLRLKEAGVNPALAFGTGSAVSQSPSAQGGSAASPGISALGSDLVNNFVAIQQSIADTKLKNAQAKQAEASASASEQDAKYNEARTIYQNTLNSWANDSEEQRIKNLEASTQSLLSNGILSSAQAASINEALPYIAKMKEQEFQNLVKQGDLIDEQVQTQLAQQYNLSSSAVAFLAQAALSRKLGDVAEADRLLREYEMDESSSRTSKNRQDARKVAEDVEAAYLSNVEKKFDLYYKQQGLDLHASPINNFLLGLKKVTENVSNSVSAPVQNSVDSALDRLNGILSPQLLNILLNGRKTINPKR